MTWTLKYSGVEKSLAAWGLGPDLQLTRGNQKADVCTVSAPALMDAELLFAYGENIIIYRDRTGSGTSWSGGSIWFQGRASTPQRSGSGTAERIRYRFHGPWWDLEHLVFQQVWRNYYAGTPPPTGVEGVDWVSEEVGGATRYFTLQRTSELFLGIGLDGSHINTGAQIAEAVGWAVTCGANLQLGAVDPAVNIVSYNVRDLTVAEVLVQMLRWSPDVVTWFDYATTPPTLKVRSLAHLEAVTLEPPTDQVKDLGLTPRQDLQLPAVVIRFKATNQVDGRSFIAITTQKYPADATGQELGASIHTIDLEGFKLTHTSVKVTLAPVLAQSGTEATRIDWWKQKLPLLNDPKLRATSLHVTSATIKDAGGATVSLSDFPRELIDGQLTDWTGYSAKHVKVEALATFDLYEDAAQTRWLGKRQRIISVAIAVTDAIVTEEDGKTGLYSTTASFSSAEPVPSGLAQSIYESCATLQYDGIVTLVGDEIPALLGMGNKLIIAGLDLTLENLLIQQTVEQPHTGTLTLTLGPSAHLGLADLIEILRVNRYRVADTIAPRTTGQAAGDGQVTLGQNTSKENTVHGHGTDTAQAATAPDGDHTAIAQIQATREDGTVDPALVLARLTPVYAVPDLSLAQMNLRLSQLPEETESEVIFRQFTLCDQTGATLTAWFAASKPKDA